MKNWFLGPALLALSLGACGGAAIPQEELTSAKAAVSGAEVGGANDQPQAAFNLKKAKDAIAEAEKLIADGDNEEAKIILARAQADADLALARAKEAKARADAQEAQEMLQKLQKKAQ